MLSVFGQEKLQADMQAFRIHSESSMKPLGLMETQYSMMCLNVALSYTTPKKPCDTVQKTPRILLVADLTLN